MILTITIFILAIIVAFGVLSFSAWEVTTGNRNGDKYPVFNISVRKTEKYVLYYTKYIVQMIVLIIAKYWFLLVTKVRKWLSEAIWPRVKAFVFRKPGPDGRPSFLHRAVIESKTKIKRIKENIKEEHSNN